MKIDGIKNVDIKKVEHSSIIKDENWSSYIDISNRLVVHVGGALLNLHIDYNNVDPDGIPVVWVERQVVTRVRRMTDEEFEKAMKRYTENIIVDVPEMRIKSKGRK